jgi:malic enzyme
LAEVTGFARVLTNQAICEQISNPTNLCECDPHAANEWTKGKALFATGSPFPDIVDEETGKTKAVAQANNAVRFAFPQNSRTSPARAEA